jgi:hypothetical protein
VLTGRRTRAAARAAPGRSRERRRARRPLRTRRSPAGSRESAARWPARSRGARPAVRASPC